MREGTHAGVSRFDIIIPVEVPQEDKALALAVELGRLVKDRALRAGVDAGYNEKGRPRGAPFGTVFLDGEPRVERA